MNRINKFVTASLACAGIYMYTEMPINAQARQVVVVRSMKYNPPINWSGLDTYDRPTTIIKSEEYILKFNDAEGSPLSGYLSVTRSFYNETWVGRQLTRTGDSYFLCRPAYDGCNSFAY